ncbi:MAG TPA: hypothetical protein VFT69_07195 [Pseudolabrys sp.]|jgi:hypothetical protein|nr:hypothetical protein [Pseudolabrys sp.]
MPTKDEIPPGRNPNANWLVLGIVVIICVVIGVIVWSGGWGFSNSTVNSPNPAPPAIKGPPTGVPVPQPGAGQK